MFIDSCMQADLKQIGLSVASSLSMLKLGASVGLIAFGEQCYSTHVRGNSPQLSAGEFHGVRAMPELLV